MNIGIVNGQWQVTNGLLYYVYDEVVNLVILSDRLDVFFFEAFRRLGIGRKWGGMKRDLGWAILSISPWIFPPEPVDC